MKLKALRLFSLLLMLVMGIGGTFAQSLADVTGSTTWDWTKTGQTEVKLTDSTTPTKSEQFIMSQAVANTEAFNSAALLISAEYPVRDGKYYQGGYIKFHTTVAGTVKVTFSNTGNRLLADKTTEDEDLRRWLYINGTKTQWGSCVSSTKTTTEAIAVEAGDVVIESYIDGNSSSQYIRVFSIEFTAESGDEPGGDEPGGDEPGGDDPVDPSTAKLLWDYTEAAPTGSPDNGLYYASNVNDAAGTKNGLKGIKLNSSGYAYFTKAAVKGTLKLTFGPRDGNKEIKVGVYTYASDPKAETLIEKTAGVTELQTISIDLTAAQNNIYINRAEGAEGVLTKVEFVPFVERTFKDFEMVLGGLSAEYDASTLPEGVAFSGTYNSDSHGYRNAVVTVPVDGTVKFTYSSCSYGNQKFSVKDANGNVVASNLELTLGSNTCYHQNANNVLTYIYTGEPTTLTFGPIQYLAYFKAEACEVAPCTVTYKDQNGTVIGTVDTFEGEALGAIPYSEANVTVPAGSAFRGWVYTSGVKATATDVVNGNTTITALVTPIESVTLGSVQTYNLGSAIFYPEDHETISIEGGYFHDAQHGWALATDGKVSVDVAGNAQIILGLCKYSKDAPITVTDAEGNVVATITSAYNENDGALATVQYEGPATTLTFTFTQGESYLHKVTVYNVKEFLAKDAETGWYIVPAGDAAAFLLALNSANAETGPTIFLPNGTYDLGEATGTTISGNNMSIIGQSMEGTIIKNAPSVKSEGLGSADLFYNTSTGLYMQDLTLQNDLDYYASGAAGRAAVLQDNGKQTILRNVAMRSYQDTYYSKSGDYYFEGGLIQGTVDYICGGGNAWFENITLLNKSRSKSGNTGDDTMTAYNGAGKYIFNNCSVESECSTFNFGRSWADAYVVYLNTTIKSGKLVDTRFSTADMNSAPRFYGEYNTTDLSGNAKNTPASNYLTTSKGGKFESVLTEAQAAEYTLESMFPSWNPKSIAAQATVDLDNISGVDPVSGQCYHYLIEKDGKFVAIHDAFNPDNLEGYTVRKANARGGFGEPTLIAPKTVEVTIDEYQYVTYYNAESAVQLPHSMEGSVTAYTVCYNAETQSFSMSELIDNLVPAATPVVLYSKTSGTYSLILKDANRTVENNDLLGSSEDTETSELVSGNADDYYYYALSLNADNEIGFYWMNSEGAAFTNGAGKAFLAIEKSKFASDSKVRGFSLNSGATAIKTVDATTTSKIYDMTGREVNAPAKGVYIMNGKKYIK